MSIEFIWQLPTAGDGRYAQAERLRRGERSDRQRPPFTDGVSDPRGNKFNYFDYAHQVARAADISGFDGLRIRHDFEGDDSWIIAGYLARGTRHIRLLTEFEASWGSSVYAAKNAVSFQRAANGRFAWQLVQGGDEARRRQHGDNLPQSEVLARIDEFVTVARGVQTTAPFTFKGRYFEVLDGGFRGPLAGNPLPPVYLSGDGAEALALSARQADVHVFDAAPLEQIRANIAALRQQADGNGRQIGAGLRIDVLARETQEEAERDAARYRQQTGAGAVVPPLGEDRYWDGYATARSGARAALVGSYEQVIATLAAYADAGVSSFLLGAEPALEEAYRIGEYVLPALRTRLAPPAQQAA
ncbi:LLM class flavin-dependent oxidoreductase [Duganella sp. sic0402]|uniref:LLM class flavin-dependent oxidoreductase n=1 Tax=Duganella sp. sic0402 TaxID=2854786 RepID=UPI001C488478|nr:LLM class flavin-dependent oxidoreductase [Duganella sp. sic0402]MBV7535195.1 LLM class flavin-dependent oxidoreductase [Duganella sp. sic0402]